MSRIHVRNADKNGNYSIVVHEPVPTGKNSAGLTRQSVYLESKKTSQTKDDGNNVIIPVDSVMTEGDGPGQIKSVELAQVQSGELMEVSLSVRVGKDVTEDVLQETVNKKVDEFVANLANELKWYGYFIA